MKNETTKPESVCESMMQSKLVLSCITILSSTAMVYVNPSLNLIDGGILF